MGVKALPPSGATDLLPSLPKASGKGVLVIQTLTKHHALQTANKHRHPMRRSQAPPQNFGPKSAKVVCSSCQASVTTTTDSRPSIMAWAISCALCFTMLWPCFCVPFCVDGFKDVKHSCPNCNATLGRYKGCV